ncbi:MAG TPA: competence/damage-inducible protein A, partial [Candidatus Eremiobacteraeota bacterium]|nr:competence/damage-inducible protein A [Candidatus Eremiobacteraeota bacterium]
MIKIAEIISIGQELVLGEIIDTNGAYLAEKFTRVGIEVRYHTRVGDYKSDLTEALKIAVKRANLILCSGGLGPTEDDITRQVIAEFCNLPLILNEEALAQIEAIFRERNLKMPENNRIQAMIPEGATIIPNKSGTAAGFCLAYRGIEIIALPGVPSEMKKMFEKLVYPELQSRSKNIIVKKLLNCFGISESALGQKIAHLMDTERNPFVGTRVRCGIISVRIQAKSRTKEEALSLISDTEKEIRSLLGTFIFGEGEERLEDVIFSKLAEKKMTLSTAESCTGGLIAHKLTNVSGISEYFLEGIVSYSNEAKIKLLHVPEELIVTYGAVSPQVAESMATGVRSLSGSDLSIGVTGIAGPTGGTAEKPVGLVYIAVSTLEKLQTEKFLFRGSREEIKERAANSALNILRLLLSTATGKKVSKNIYTCPC